ncbi:ABC transporter permease [soil metagenome]
MPLREGIRLALQSIRAHKLRAFFTILGTVVGVTFLIAVITLIEGMNAYMEEDFAGTVVGFNTVTVQRTADGISFGPTDRRALERRPRLTFDDAEWLRERMRTPGVMAVESDRSGEVQGRSGKPLENVRIVGASADYFRVRKLDLEQGRPFGEQEAQRGVPVAVIGSEVAEKLFEGRSPLGGTVRVQRFPFRVIGVLEEQGSLFGFSMDNVVITPARSPVNGFVNPHDVVDGIAYRVPDADLLPTAEAELTELMRIRHRLRPGEENDFATQTAEAAIGFWKTISNVMLIALPLLVGISLVVGAVVIMNIMLMSVTERTREIGLRKALGARRRDILLQFLVEVGTLTGAGGVLGIAAGAALAALVSALSPIPGRVAPWSVALGLFLGIGVGIAAGIYPASRAAKLDPIEALRHE